MNSRNSICCLYAFYSPYYWLNLEDELPIYSILYSLLCTLCGLTNPFYSAVLKMPFGLFTSEPSSPSPAE